MVVVDEAAQAVEPSTLIPLRYGCVQAVLVGDPAQLPPTVMCRAAARRGYDRSLFARLADGGYSTHLLDTQYRMHPALSAFPSSSFYSGRIRDAPAVCGSARQSPLLAESFFRPLLFYDLFNAQQGASGEAASAAAGADKSSTVPASVAPGGRPSQKSFSNRDEADFIVALLRVLNAWRGHDASGQRIRFSGSVGVISFYRGQVDLLQRLVDAAFPAKSPPSSVDPAVKQPGPSDPRSQPLHFSLDINTVDGYQGSERDIIIVSCVRTLPADLLVGDGSSGALSVTTSTLPVAVTPLQPTAAPSTATELATPASEHAGAVVGANFEAVVSSAIGFVNDPRRMNVALTRGKFACWVIGNARALCTSSHWRAFIQHCRDAAGGGCAAVPVADPKRFTFSEPVGGA